MSSRVKNARVSKAYSGPKSTADRDALLSAIFQNCVEMPSCSSCEDRGIESCQVSPLDSSRCAECVRLGSSSCDVLGPSPSDIRKISSQHKRLEEQIEAEEERLRDSAAKLERLRKQKKMWSKKMYRAIRRGLDSVEEFDRVENEETEAERKRIAEQSAGVVQGGSVEEAGGMVAQEAWLRSEGEVGVFDWSSVVGPNVEWEKFLEVGTGNGSPVGGSSGQK